MAAAALGFGYRPDTGYGRSFTLAFVIHAVLLAVLFLGVRIQSSAPESVQVELWEPPPPPQVRPVEPPKPLPPKVEPEPPKPEPKIEKPQIVEKAAPKPKPKPEPKKAEPKPKPVPKAEPKPPARDLELEQRMRDQLAQEQAASEARRAKEQAVRAQASARARALNEYIARIQAKVKSNWILPLDLQGNPEAIFLVSQLPSGEVLSVRIVKSSGNPAYDTAVERAILKSSPLPLPAAREDFSRELKLTFRPQDK
jgi:colicin import membrane protein